MASGLQFKATRAGNFSPSASSSEKGANAGERAGDRPTMHAKVTIADMQAFVDNPDHPGNLNDSVHFPPLGDDLPATDEVFNRVGPAGKPNLKQNILFNYQPV
ncbi:MAG: hypothetical protein R3F41_07675 [Gammaproteobacteria bacterium]|nr:hypothetical protein [Pseudomonadales bacterium]